jgi:hypothetical protein
MFNQAHVSVAPLQASKQASKRMHVWKITQHLKVVVIQLCRANISEGVMVSRASAPTKYNVVQKSELLSILTRTWDL